MAMPHNLEAERLLLGAIFARNELIYEVMERIEQRDFFDRGHGELFILLVDIIPKGRHATPLTVMHDYGQDRDINGVKASEYLRELDDEAPPGNLMIARNLARTVYDLAVRRRCLVEIRELAAEFQSAPVSMRAEEIQERLGKSLVNVLQSSRDTGSRHVGAVARDVLERINDASRMETSSGLSLPLRSLSELLGPLMGGRLYTLCGTPGSGKSSLAQQIGEWVGNTPGPEGRNRVCLMVQIEMSAEEVAERAISARTRYPAEKMERGIFQPGEWESLADAAQRLEECSFYIDSALAPTVQDIRWKAIARKATSGLDLLIVDHALYIRSMDRRMSELEVTNDLLMTLKATAKELDIPILLLTQFYGEALRDIAKWPHRRPRKGDMHHAAMFDRHSDAILIVHREEAVLAENTPARTEEYKGKPYYADWEARLMGAEGKAELYLAKRRGGKGHGKRDIWFDAEITRFSDERPRSLLLKEHRAANQTALDV